MQRHVQRIEDHLSNLTLDISRKMAEVNFNVNLIVHKLDDYQVYNHIILSSSSSLHYISTTSFAFYYILLLKGFLLSF